MLDYACGSNADCVPIQPSAACFAPDNVRAHYSYTVNNFHQRSGQKPLNCVFSGTAVLSSVDPCANGCKYPATATPRIRAMPRQAQICDCLGLGLVHLGLGQNMSLIDGTRLPEHDRWDLVTRT
ncbi:hypothetical protein ZWY2020_024460 [Hordeum vulgare]|nr:hypothetical protein ZWY2020_024460 [Hordeum vulgare]